MMGFLVDGARAIRVPMLAGYSTLLTLYISLHGRLPERDSLSKTQLSLVELYDGFGSTGQTAFWAALAFLIGSVLSNWFFDKLVTRVAKFPNGPDWAAFIEAARRDVRHYEENPFKDGFRYSAKGPEAPSQHHASVLGQEVAKRERMESEVQFRMALSLTLLPPVVALIVQGGSSWAVCLIPSVIIWIDMSATQDRARATINQARREYLNRRRSEIHKEIGLNEGHQGNTAQLPETLSLEILGPELLKIDTELTVLDATLDRYVSRQVLRSRKVKG
jgi:hypothetical protein